MIRNKVSFCLGVCNEESILLNSFKKIENGLKEVVGPGNYEIIVVENGSTDNTRELLENIRNKNIRQFSLSERGLGNAYRIAIKKSRFSNIVLSALDLPFGFGDLKQAQKYFNKVDIIFGSKMHPQSNIKRDWKRTVTSKVYNLVLKSLFNVTIKDTQGTIFISKKAAKILLPFCTAKDAFFTAQLAIYGQLNDLKMIEVPVTLEKEMRPSRFNLLKDGLKIFKSIVNEYGKYSENKNRVKSM